MQLPVWFRHYGVKTRLRRANPVLKRYMRYYNSEQIHREIRTTPQKKFFSLREESKLTKVGSEIDLDKIFSYRYERKVGRDNTIRYNGAVYQLERKPFIYSYTGKKAEIRHFPNKPLSIYIDDESVRHKKLLTVTKKAVKSKGDIHGKVAI